MKDIQTLFLDAVGTLFGIREAPGEVYARFAQAHGIAVDSDRVAASFFKAWKGAADPVYESTSDAATREAVDRSWWQAIVRESLRLADATPEESQFQACFEDIFTYYGTAEPWHVYPDTLDVLPRLHARYKLVVLSNFDGRLLKVMDALELTPLVHHVLYSSALGACKPSPKAFDRALQAAKSERAHTLHIGDDPDTDAKGAAAAGLQFFHLKRPESDLHTLEKHLAQAL